VAAEALSVQRPVFAAAAARFAVRPPFAAHLPFAVHREVAYRDTAAGAQARVL
jgi:hypothetical protein